MAAEITMVRPSLTLDVPRETSLRVADRVAQMGGFCEDSETWGEPSRIVFYDDPTDRPITSSPRVSDDFRQRVDYALTKLGIAVGPLRIGYTTMGTKH